jgi:AraC-like DNA-binding protein
VATIFARPLSRALHARGVDPERVLAPFGLCGPVLPERIPVSRAASAWLAAVQATGEPALGLHTSRALSPGDYGILEYLARVSPTLGAAAERLGRYHALLNCRAEVALLASGPLAYVRYIVPPSTELPRPYLELVLATWVRFGQEMTGDTAAIAAVHLPYPAPADTGLYPRLLGCEVRFECPHAEIAITRAMLARPLPRGDLGLVAVLDRHAEALLAQSAPTTLWTKRVSDEVEARLPDGTPRLAEVADALGVAERALRRHLERERTSFAAVVDATRRRLAAELVENPGLSLGEIAFLLGFSEASAFHRAYRRWTGRTPRPPGSLRQAAAP